VYEVRVPYPCSNTVCITAGNLQVGDKVLHSDILMDGEELDAPFPMTIMINKPVGYVVTAPDDEKILDPKIYDLLPYRYSDVEASRGCPLVFHWC
jgi:16S rRNA U516 pseudouridylate synthase RsuA-like enzyme